MMRMFLFCGKIRLQRCFFSVMLLLTWSSREVSSFTASPCETSTGFTSSRLYMSSMDRRHLLGSILAGTSFLLPPLPSTARGLVQFPCTKLENTYHFIRAGQSLMEQDDIWSTNPLFLTNRDSALSERGIQQVVDTCKSLNEQNINPTIVMYSLAASAMDTANIVGRELKIGRDRLVPEFTYLDPRAVGMWDMLPMTLTQAAVWAMDNDEAGADGRGARPPPNEDGTPNETLDNQGTRLRQLFSLMETQYSGDTVILVFPDGTGPALLSAMISGIPLNRVHELNYQPGEIRLDVTMKSTRELLNSGTLAEDYKDVLASGRQELKRLRSLKPDEVVSVKDQKLEQDRLEMEAAVRQREAKRRAKEEQDHQAREMRVRQIEEEGQKRREAKRRAKEEQDHQAREMRVRQIEEERQKRREEQGLSDGSDNTTPIVLGASTIGVSAAVVALFSGESDNDKDGVVALDENPVEVLSNATATLVPNTELEIHSVERPIVESLDVDSDEQLLYNDDSFMPPTLGVPRNDTNFRSLLDNNRDGKAEEDVLRQRVNGDRLATFPPPQKLHDPVKAAEQAMKEYMEMDDGACEWLQMVSDIILEEDEEDNDSVQPRGLRP